MKILMLNYEYPPLGGGASSVTRGLSENLVKKGHDVDVVTMSYQDEKGKSHENGVTVYRVPCFRSKVEVCEPYEMFSYIVSALNFVAKLVRKKEYDINHTHFLIPTGLVSYFLDKLVDFPYIVSLHGSDVPGYNPDRFQFWHKFTSFPITMVGKRSERIISPSNFLAEMLSNNVSIDRSHIDVIPHGIDPVKYSPGEKENRILMVSRLVKRKGFQHFLNSIKDLDLNNYTVSIVGEGPYRKKLEEIAEKISGEVKVHGWVSEEKLEQLYGSSKIFVFPSSKESFGMVILEAMSAGMAVITSNRSACPEVVGNTGIVIDPKNSKKIRKTVQRLVVNDNLIEELGKKAREKVKNQYSWDKITEKYIGLYRRKIE